MADPKPIDYDRTVTTVTVRGFRTLLLLLLINTLMLGWFIIGPQASGFLQHQWRQWQAQRAEKKQQDLLLATQRQCFEHTFPPDTVIVEERPDAALRLLAAEPGYRPFRAPSGESGAALTKPPAHWTAFVDRIDGVTGGGLFNSDQTLVYLHEHVSPVGSRRLVAVELDVDTDRGTSRSLTATSFMPLAANEPARKDDGIYAVLRTEDGSDSHRNPAEPPMTILSGQTDATDRSHFTIPYLVNGRPGVIDGWLRDDGLVLKPRSGEAAINDNQLVWTLSPTTAPATRPR